MKRKLLSVLLTFCLAFSLLPTAALADGVDNCTENCGHVAAIGTTHYSTLQEAVDAATAGQTVKLVADVTEDITIPTGKNITLDLGNSTLTNKSGDTIVVEIGATLTVTGSGTVDNVTHGKAAIYNNGTVILNGGSYLEGATARERNGQIGGHKA